MAADPVKIADAVINAADIDGAGSEALRRHLNVFTADYACDEYLSLLTKKARPVEKLHGEDR